MKCKIGQPERCLSQGVCAWFKAFKSGDCAQAKPQEHKIKSKVKKKRQKINKKKRIKVYNNANGICYICKEIVQFEEFTIDHVIPWSKGGTDDVNNLRPTHEGCNQKKGNKIYKIK